MSFREDISDTVSRVHGYISHKSRVLLLKLNLYDLEPPPSFCFHGLWRRETKRERTIKCWWWMMVIFTISLCELVGDGLEATTEFFVLIFVINGHTLVCSKGSPLAWLTASKETRLISFEQGFCSVYILYLNNYSSNIVLISKDLVFIKVDYKFLFLK